MRFESIPFKNLFKKYVAIIFFFYHHFAVKNMPIFENSYWIFNKKITIIFLKSKMAEKRENAEQEE